MNGLVQFVSITFVIETVPTGTATTFTVLVFSSAAFMASSLTLKVTV